MLILVKDRAMREAEGNMVYVEGQIIVVFHDTETKENAEKFVESLGLKSINWSQFSKRLIVGVPIGEELDWKYKIRQYPNVKNSDVNYIYHLLRK